MERKITLTPLKYFLLQYQLVYELDIINGQMVLSLARSMERSTNLRIICRYYQKKLVKKNPKIIL